MNTIDPSRRRVRHSSVVAALAVPALALTTAVLTPAGANAQDSSAVITDLFPAPDRLVALGGSPSGLCYGAVSTTITPGGYPDSATVGWAIGLVGVGGCDLTVTLSWHNLDTHAHGEKTAYLPTPGFSGGMPNPIAHPYDAIIGTGPGRVEYRLTTDGGAVSGPIVVVTPAYGG